LIAHKLNGALATFHIEQYSKEGVGMVISRLSYNKPAFWGESALLASWLLYLAATVGLVALSVRFRPRPAVCGDNQKNGTARVPPDAA
jgi:hypothetical protein